MIHLRRFDGVAALYVDPRGPYPHLTLHTYDSTRDARTYTDPLPVVAHPPCGPWSAPLRHRCRQTTQALAHHALATIRRTGGVLEHPAHSRFWPAAHLPPPGQYDPAGGFTTAVHQQRWGHPAPKNTWLYIAGLARTLPPLPPPPRRLTGNLARQSSTTRSRTPPAFAAWLCELASRSQPPVPPQ